MFAMLVQCSQQIPANANALICSSFINTKSSYRCTMSSRMMYVLETLISDVSIDPSSVHDWSTKTT